MNRLEWIFELLDRVSAPARRISSSVDRVGRSLRLASDASRRAHHVFQTSTEGSVRAVYRLADAVGALRLAEGFDSIRAGAISSVEAVRGLTRQAALLRNLLIGGLVAGGVGLAAKSLIDQVGFIEQQRIALSTMLKSPIRGQTTLEWAIGFADKTFLDTADVLESLRIAVGQGFKTTQIEKLFKVLTDTAAGTGSKLEDLITIFAQMRSAGKIVTQDVNQLAYRGIAAWEYMARGLGKTVPEIRKLVEQGAIDSATGMRLIFEGLQRDYAGLSEAQSKTVFGLMSTLRSRPVYLAFQLERDKALEPFRKVLLNLVELTDFSKPPGSDIGKRLKEGLGTAFKVAFEPLAKLTEPKAAMGYIQGFVDGVVNVAGGLVKLWPTVKGAIGEFVEGVKAGFKALRAGWEMIRPAVEWLGRLTGGFTEANTAAGQTSGFMRLLGFLAALAGAWRVLNILTLGGVGILGRLVVMASRGLLVRLGVLGLGTLKAAITAVLRLAIMAGKRFLIRIGVLGTPAIGATGARLRGLGGVVIRVGASVMRMGSLLRMAWLAGMGPVGWVIAGIMAVGGAFIALYNRSKRFRDGVNAVWKSISGAARSAWEGVVALFSSLPDRVIQAVRRAGPAFVEALKAVVRSAPGGEFILKGLEATAGFVRGAVRVGAQVGGALVQGAKDILGIKSPSRVFEHIGRMAGVGLMAGLLAYATAVEQAGAALASRAIPEVKVGLPKVEAAKLSILPAAIPAPPAPHPPSVEVEAGYVPAPVAERRAITVNLTLNVQGFEGREELVERLREVAVEAVLMAIERAAVEEGA